MLRLPASWSSVPYLSSTAWSFAFTSHRSCSIKQASSLPHLLSLKPSHSYVRNALLTSNICALVSLDSTNLTHSQLCSIYTSTSIHMESLLQKLLFSQVISPQKLYCIWRYRHPLRAICICHHTSQCRESLLLQGRGTPLPQVAHEETRIQRFSSVLEGRNYWRGLYNPPLLSPKRFHVEVEANDIVLLFLCRESPKSRESGSSRIARLNRILSSTTRMVRHVTPRELPER